MSLLRSSRKPSTRRSANTERRPMFSYTGPKRPATGQPDEQREALRQRTGEQSEGKQHAGDNEATDIVMEEAPVPQGASKEPEPQGASKKSEYKAPPPDKLWQADIDNGLRYMSDVLLGGYNSHYNIDDETNDDVPDAALIPNAQFSMMISEKKVPRHLLPSVINIMKNARDTGYFPDPSAGATKSNAIQRIPQPLPSADLGCLKNPQLIATLPTDTKQLAQLMTAFDYLAIEPLIRLLGAAIAVKVMNSEGTAAGASKSE